MKYVGQKKGEILCKDKMKLSTLTSLEMSFKVKSNIEVKSEESE